MSDKIIIDGEEYDEEDVGECVRCEVQEARENMTDSDMGYLCECCHGDLN